MPRIPLLVFTFPTPSSRLSYIFRMMMEDILGLSCRLTSDPEEFENHEGLKFSYGDRCSDEIHFGAVPLLFEKGIRKIPLDPVAWNGYRLFFPVEDSVWPFDPFAVSFYLISRYEEYLPGRAEDPHGRFDLTGAAAFRNGFHRQPLVNRISHEIAKILRKRFPGFSPPSAKHTILYTYDVDMAYQYKGKSPARFAASLLKALCVGNKEKVEGLWHALQGKEFEDAYDTFEDHRKNNASRDNKPIHFILTAPFGQYDRNINPQSKAFSQLVEQLSLFSEIGIHPSYRTLDEQGRLSREKKQLESVYGKKITKSRQHYLRLSFPSTFQNLVKNGITDDYSLGWTCEVGFRSSTATPHLFYDLSQERETSLLLHPLTIMDGALAGLADSTEERKLIFHTLLDEVKCYGGEFILLQHNSFSEKFDQWGAEGNSGDTIP